MPVPTDLRSRVCRLFLLLCAGALLGSCGGGPRRERVDGVEYVYNPATPARGEVLPDPRPAADLRVVTAGEEGAPPWSAVRDVRAWPGGGWAVLDMHRAEITVLDGEGHTVSLLDLSASPINLVSPVALAVTDTAAAAADLALRRVVRFSLAGGLLAAFEVAGGIPADLAAGHGGGYLLLTVARPSAGREQITQVRGYGPGGELATVAGQDSLLLEHRASREITRPLPQCLDMGPEGTLSAASMEYHIAQVLPDGGRRVLVRPPMVTRVPGYVLRQRRALMSHRVPAQQRSLPVTGETEITCLLALDDGELLVQTTDWHPALLDTSYAGEHQVILMDRFRRDGVWAERRAVRLPLPRTIVTLTDAHGGWIYGWSTPFSGEGSITVFRFRLENLP